jgi:5-methylcytosine-specific restriction protein A
MPDAPPRPCPQPGCPALVKSGYCEAHRPKARKTSERGYDGAWRKLRRFKLATDPVCQIRTHCQGMVATEVDHIIPISVRPDLRLELSNLQSACKPCNAAKGDRAVGQGTR